MADDLSAVGRFLYEVGTLKHTRRTGWWMADEPLRQGTLDWLRAALGESGA